MIPKEQQAAHLLEGKILEGGWKVVKKLNPEKHNTGGVYSSCYEVQNGSRKGFLKAFDYSAASKIGAKSAADQIKNILNAFTLEREILLRCNQSRCKNVIALFEHGAIEIEEATKYPNVEYLILEYAEKGDIRDAIEENRATLKFKIKSLHQLANGLRQIHKLSIAHQDIKPSNIVTFENDVTKITDFGSAVMLNSTGLELPLHLQKDFAGTWAYAPPELLYGEINTNDVIRRIGCDLYLLGSMIAFYFTNLSMTALIKDNLDDTLSWTLNGNQGKYQEIKSFLILAYEEALTDIRRSIDNDDIKESIMTIVRYLCHPDPNMRGHAKNINEIGPNYNLERFVTMFDRMEKTLSSKGY